MQIKDTHDFTPGQLQDLFLSVEWSSGHFPDKLAVAMRNFKTVFSAWDGDKLIGMICAMDDGVMNAYVHYLLVHPEYQGKGVGQQLVERMKAQYKDYLRIVVVSGLLRALRIQPRHRCKPDVHHRIVDLSAQKRSIRSSVNHFYVHLGT